MAVNYPDDAHYPDRILELGSTALALRADVGSVREIEALFAALMQEFGRLDILVITGYLPGEPGVELDERTWDAVHSVNLKGTFFCAQQAARLMVSQGSGRIINIASVSAWPRCARCALLCK